MLLLHDLKKPDDPLRTAAFVYVTTASVLIVLLASAAAVSLRLLPLMLDATVKAMPVNQSINQSINIRLISN
jgi:hypothetical protein